MLCNTPFTWYNRLTTGLTNSHCSFNWLSNRVLNRLNVCIHDTGLTTGCIVYTNIQPVWQQVVSCKRGLSVLLASQFTHCVQSKFQLLVTLLLNTDFLTSSLNFPLNTFLSCPLRPSSSVSRMLYMPSLFYVSVKPIRIAFSNQIKPKYSPCHHTLYIQHQLCDLLLNTFNELNVFGNIWNWMSLACETAFWILHKSV